MRFRTLSLGVIALTLSSMAIMEESHGFGKPRPRPTPTPTPTQTIVPSPTPTPTETPGPAPTARVLSGPAEYTSQSSHTLNFTGTGDGPLRFECSMDELAGGVVEPCTSPKTYTNLPEGGSRGFRVYAIDRFNRRSSAALHRFTVDRTAPSVNVTSRPSDSTATSASIGFTGSDSHSSVGGFECRLDGAAFGACASPKSYSGLSIGTHTFQVRATDLAGNVSATASVNWTVSAQPTNPGELRLTPEWINSDVISQWRPSSIANGWYPKLSSDVRYLVCGFGGIFAADLATGAERQLSSSGFNASWIRPGQFTFTEEINSNTLSRRLEGNVSDWVPHVTADDPALVHGSLFGADGGNWASWIAGIGRLAWNNQVLMGSGAGGGLSISGNQIAHAKNVNGEYRGIMLWENGQLIREFPHHIAGEAHQLTLSRGYIVYGGYGPVHGIRPDGTDLDVTVTPWRWEGSPVVFFVGNQPWIGTVTFNATLNRGYTLLRPFGEKASIVLDDGVRDGNHQDTDAIYLHVVENDGILTIASNDPKGKMQVRKIPVNAPRYTLLPL